jgi:hypothetical protein
MTLRAVVLGVPAFAAVVVIYYLMVASRLPSVLDPRMGVARPGLGSRRSSDGPGNC